MQPTTIISDKVSEQLLAICCRNTARAAVPLLLSILFTYFLLHDSVSSTFLQPWALACCTLVLTRVAMLKVISQSARLSHLHKRILATLLTLALGCGIASILYIFNSLNLFERAMLLAVMLGISTTSYSINIGYPPLLLSYIGPLLGTSCALWISTSISDFNDSSVSNTNSLLGLAVSACIFIVAATMIRNGKFMFDAFTLAIDSSTKLEEQSERLSEALRHAEDAKQAAEVSSQSKTRFIAAASHDLRQPVHVLNLFSGALRNAPLDKPVRDIVDNMDIAVNSLSSQLNSLLDMSELDSGSVKPNFHSTDLSRLSQMLMSELCQLATDKKLELINEVPAGLHVNTDPDMLAQIIRNLCGNAIKYTQEGCVRIVAKETQADIVLSIIDTGVGIDQGDCDKVFEEFYQVAKKDRDKEKGLGLGLSIVHRLITTLGHKIELSSSIGIGTTVSITMKRCEAADLPAPASSSRSSQAETLPQGFWVHIVDDETAVQNSAVAFLETVGARVTSSRSSSEAMRFLDKHKPDAVLIDLRLQDGDSGLTVVEAMQDTSVPVALISGESIDESTLASEYPDLLMLQKPVSDDALLDLLEYMSISVEHSVIGTKNSLTDDSPIA
jgi:signal transduction histidine kinase/CheY-like chemotaxis protein